MTFHTEWWIKELILPSLHSTSFSFSTRQNAPSPKDVVTERCIQGGENDLICLIDPQFAAGLMWACCLCSLWPPKCNVANRLTGRSICMTAEARNEQVIAQLSPPTQETICLKPPRRRIQFNLSRINSSWSISSATWSQHLTLTHGKLCFNKFPSASLLPPQKPPICDPLHE